MRPNSMSSETTSFATASRFGQLTMAKPASRQDSPELAQRRKHLVIMKMFDAVGAPDRIERSVFNNPAHIGDRSNDVGGVARHRCRCALPSMRMGRMPGAWRRSPSLIRRSTLVWRVRAPCVILHRVASMTACGSRGSARAIDRRRTIDRLAAEAPRDRPRRRQSTC